MNVNEVNFKKYKYLYYNDHIFYYSCLLVIYTILNCYSTTYKYACFFMNKTVKI